MSGARCGAAGPSRGSEAAGPLNGNERDHHAGNGDDGERSPNQPVLQPAAAESQIGGDQGQDRPGGENDLADRPGEVGQIVTRGDQGRAGDEAYDSDDKAYQPLLQEPLTVFLIDRINRRYRRGSPDRRREL